MREKRQPQGGTEKLKDSFFFFFYRFWFWLSPFLIHTFSFFLFAWNTGGWQPSFLWSIFFVIIVISLFVSSQLFPGALRSTAGLPFASVFPWVLFFFYSVFSSTRKIKNRSIRVRVFLISTIGRYVSSISRERTKKICRQCKGETRKKKKKKKSVE